MNEKTPEVAPSGVFVFCASYVDTVSFLAIAIIPYANSYFKYSQPSNQNTNRTELFPGDGVEGLCPQPSADHRSLHSKVSYVILYAKDPPISTPITGCSAGFLFGQFYFSRKDKSYELRNC